MAAMTRPMLEVTARWQEDLPGGFAVTVAFETSALGEQFARQLLRAFEGLDGDVRWTPAVALGHLRDVGRLPESMRHETIRRRAVGIVAWLQQRGHLVADEHNGIVWARPGEVAEAPRAPRTPVPPAVASPPAAEGAGKPRKAARPRAASRERTKPAKKASKKPRKKV
jgi:hypothetical protein